MGSTIRIPPQHRRSDIGQVFLRTALGQRLLGVPGMMERSGTLFYRLDNLGTLVQMAGAMLSLSFITGPHWLFSLQLSPVHQIWGLSFFALLFFCGRSEHRRTAVVERCAGYGGICYDAVGLATA